MSDKSKAILFSILTIIGYAGIILFIIGMFFTDVAWALFSMFLLAIPSYFYRKALSYSNKVQNHHLSMFVKGFVPVFSAIIILGVLFMLPGFYEIFG